MAENPENNATTSGVTIGVVKESVPGETRVGLIPDSVKHLVGKGLQVIVQTGAGEGSSIADSEYEEAGAQIVPTTADIHADADVVVRVQSPSPDRGELDGLKRDQVLVSFLAPLVNHDLNRQLADSGVTAMAVDAVPRITRAQSMDALSAMSTIGGYKAVLLAAEKLPKFFPLLMTAAGTIRPAKVLVLGAGVAGLQAIATARRLGAVVEAYDVRAVVKEQVESLGAKFVEIDTGAGNAEAVGGYAREATPEELKKQQEGLNEHIANSDVVITTALVPGRPAPKMIPASAVERMRAGSVIVDLAAETGGNCELTTPGEVTKEHGVTIFGTLNLPATLPVHASQMYGKVMTNFLDLLVKDGRVNLNFEDEIIANMTITNRGEIVQAQTRKMMGLEEAEPAPPAETEVAAEADEVEPEASNLAADGGLSPDGTDPRNDEPDGAVETESSVDNEPTASTYIPFADEASGESSEAGNQPDSPTGYKPFTAPNETVADISDPSTEITSYSVDEGYETVADQSSIELEDETVASDLGSAGYDAGEPFSAEPDSGVDALSADDGSALDVESHADETELVAADDGSEPESNAFEESKNFSGSVPEVDRVNEYDSGSNDRTVEADKLESFLKDENFDADTGGESGANQERDESDKPQSVADARKSSKLPLVGEGTDWVAGDDTHDIPAGFPIKGNANSGIYHPQESPSYSETIAEIYFTTGEAAESHGYRLPKMLQKMADQVGEDAAATAGDLKSSRDESVDHVEEENDRNG